MLASALARCITHTTSQIPQTLAVALSALDAPALVEDSCRLELSTRTRDTSLCEGVHLSALRERCNFRAAIATGITERCPAALGLRGRDPVCVAVASRLPSLCALCLGDDRPRCLALTLHQPSQCANVSPSLRAECEQDLSTLASFFSAARRAPSPTTEVTLAPAAGDASTPSPDARALSTLPSLTRGAWLDTTGTLWLVDPSFGWPDTLSLGGVDPIVAVRFEVALARRGDSPASARLILPGRTALDTADNTLRARASLRIAPHTRGDRVAGEVVFTTLSATSGASYLLRFDTLIRDVVSPTDLR